MGYRNFDLRLGVVNLSAVNRIICLLLAVAALSPSLDSDAGEPIQVVTENRDGAYALVVTNSSPGPYRVIVSLTKAENITAAQSFPITAVVRGGASVIIGTIQAADPRRGHSFNFQYSYRFGDPKAAHDPRASYRLPFQNGKAFTIAQAWGGPLTTHNSPESMYAVDIPMPSGTTIVAARAGIVVGVARPFDEGRQTPDFLSKSNYVRILHADGTWAEYAHLLRFTSNINPGQWIVAGTPIGLSGNSGYSSGPHLHFVVQRNEGTRAVSVPFRFFNRSLGEFEPTPGLLAAADYSGVAASTDATPSTQTPGQSQGTSGAPRSLRECMGTKREIDNDILRCVRGGR